MGYLLSQTYIIDKYINIRLLLYSKHTAGKNARNVHMMTSEYLFIYLAWTGMYTSSMVVCTIDIIQVHLYILRGFKTQACAIEYILALRIANYILYVA